MWKHKTKWLVRGGRKVRCYLCGKKILASGDLFLFHGDTGYYSHQSCLVESTTISGNERRKAVKKIAVGAAVVGAIAAGAGKFLDVSSQSKNSPTAQTILTSQGLIPPALTSDPANPVPGQMWYRSDAGVMAHFDGVQNRVVYSSEINDGNVHVTSKGIINGLSVLPNDGTGWFGPDTTKGATAPGQYGSPYTQAAGIPEAVNYAYQLALDSTTDSLSNYGTVYQTVYILKGIYICNEDITIPSNSSGASVSMLNGDINSNIFFTQNNAKGIVLDAFNGVFTIKNLNILYFPVGGSTSNYTGISLIHADWSAFPSGNTALFLHNVTMDDGYSKISSPSSTSGGLFANGAGSLIAYNLVLAAGNLLSVNNCTVVDFFNPQFSAGYYFSNNNTVLFMGGLVEYGIGFFGGYSVTFINTSLDASSSSQQMIFVSSVNILTVINATLTFYLTNQSVFLVGNGSSTNYSTGAIRVKGLTVNMVNTTSTTPNTFKYGNFGTGGYQINPTALDVDVPTIVGYGSYITQYMVPTTPSVPTSGTAQQNTNQYPVDVYIYGGDVTEIQITKNGTAYTVLSVSTAIAMSGQHYPLNPKDSITITYSTAPTWEWL